MRYESWSLLGSLSFLFLLANGGSCQQPAALPRVPVHLQVEAGTPLRVYITRRVPYRAGAIVQAKVIEPVWAFDRIVIPAGTILQGRVVRLDPVSKMERARAIVGGDFTPLKRAEVSFTRLTLPDGRVMPLQTEESLGLPTLYVPPRPSKKPKRQKKGSSAKSSRVRQFLKQQAQSQANARSRGFYDLVRGPNKREWLENYVLSKLPYHPQWYRARTRFDTVLAQPLDFGTVEVAASELATSGNAPPPDSTAQMRLLTTVTSADARVGDPIQGVLSAPLFTKQRKLVLPEGTRFTGRITLAQHARLFHRGGKLRFTIESVGASPSEVASDNTLIVKSANQPLQGQLVSVEADPKAVKVDPEGTATATESKTRLLRPVIAALVATKSLDNDAGKQTASGTGAGTGSNLSGRSLGGFSGLGLLGTAAAYGPRPIGAALGFYGLAWSVYSNIIARGSEITFQKNTAIAIQFGNPPKK